MTDLAAVYYNECESSTNRLFLLCS